MGPGNSPCGYACTGRTHNVACMAARAGISEARSTGGWPGFAGALPGTSREASMPPLRCATRKQLAAPFLSWLVSDGPNCTSLCRFYGYLIAFDAQGKFIGLSAEGPAAAWPEDVRTREVRAEPAAMVELVREWTARRPEAMLGVIWYRLPVEGERLNWPWRTLARSSWPGVSLCRSSMPAYAGLNPV